MRRIWLAFVVAACGGSTASPPDTPDVVVGPTYEIDPSFGTTGRLAIPIQGAMTSHHLALLGTSNGIIVIADSADGITICRFDVDGVLDVRFAGGCIRPGLLGGAQPRGALTDGTDLIVAARPTDPTAGPSVFRFRADGTRDPSALAIGPAPTATVTELLRLSDGAFVAGGTVAAGTRWAQRIEGTTVGPSVDLDPGLLVTSGDQLAVLAPFSATVNDCPATCSPDEVCRYGVCTAPLPACDSSCPQHRCDAVLGECLPESIAPTGADVTRLTATLDVIDRAHVGHLPAQRAFALSDGRVLVSDEAATSRFLPDGTRDLSFGGEDGRTIPITAATERSDGSVVAATVLGFDRAGMVEVDTRGIGIGFIESPLFPELVDAVHVLDETLVLAAARTPNDVIVTRLVRTPP